MDASVLVTGQDACDAARAETPQARGTRCPFTEFMGYTQPWYSVRGLDEPVGGDMGYFVSYLRDGDRVFLPYSTTGRGTEVASGSFTLLDLTPYGRGEAWQDTVPF